MEKEFIPYEQAQALKELGFDEPCLATKTSITKDEEIYIESDELITNSTLLELTKKLIELDESPEDVVTAPLYQQAFRWFREKHNLVISITVYNDDFDYIIYFPNPIEESTDNIIYTSYEEAEQACLEKLIEIVKNKSNGLST